MRRDHRCCHRLEMLNSLKSRASCCDGRAEQNMRIAWSSRSKDGLGWAGLTSGWITATCKQLQSLVLVQSGGGV